LTRLRLILIRRRRNKNPFSSVLIRSIRSIRFAILSLLAKRGEASKSAERLIVVLIVVKLTMSYEKYQD
jgi:hypothetical protein